MHSQTTKIVSFWIVLCKASVLLIWVILFH